MAMYENFDRVNLKRVDLADALKRADDWVVDWHMDLTQEQACFVRIHSRDLSKFAERST